MAVDTGKIQIDPYKSDVPLVQLPMEAPPPAQPLRGQFGGGRGSGKLAIGDAIFKGFMQGHAVKEQRKYQQAEATMKAADAGADAAHQQYQDVLSSVGGKADDPQAKAAYDAYVAAFNQSKQVKAKYVIPDKPEKGQKKEKGKEGNPVGNIKDWFAANPHVVPSIALLSMQPKPPGQSRETKLQDLEMQRAQGGIELQKAELSGEQQKQKTAADAEQRTKQQRAVEQAGGVDAVLADKKADPELQMAAKEIKFSALDAQSPEGKMKTSLLQDMQNGNSKDWTPQQRTLAGAFGIVPQPVPTTVAGKNGHQQQVLIDPTTNQPVPGSKPLDLGPPAWATEFYAKRAADHADLRKAVESDPAAYGVNVEQTKDPKALKASIEARVQQMVVQSEFGISTVAQSAGKTGYEVQRDNSWLNDTVTDLNKQFDKSHPTATFEWPGGGKVDLSKEQANQILGQFMTDPTETAGIRTFRQAPAIGGGKDSGAAERDRLWAYQFVKNRMMATKGKAALTSQQADEILKNTALGRPIPQQANNGKPAERKLSFMDSLRDGIARARFSGASATATQSSPGPMTRPSSGVTKMYMVPGHPEPVELTDDEAQKARTANIQLEEVSSLTQ